MAYEKHTWECGEAITTEKLNHIEDGIANAGEGSECTSSPIWTSNTMTVETHEMQGTTGIYVGTLPTDKVNGWIAINVVYDGTRYNGIRRDSNGVYGDIDPPIFPVFDRYPFVISGTMIATETSGTHTIVVEGLVYDSVAEPCLEQAIIGVMQNRIKIKNLLLLVDEAVTIPAKSLRELNFSLDTDGGYTMPDNIVSCGIVTCGADLNFPGLLIHSVVLGNLGETASMKVYNTTDTAITINAGRQTHFRIDVCVTVLDLPKTTA